MLPLFPSPCSGRPILRHRPANNGKQAVAGPALTQLRLVLWLHMIASFFRGIDNDDVEREGRNST